ncbi:MAG: hypothetical protein ACKOFJ_05565, partial [Actinomycetota bacterium]
MNISHSQTPFFGPISYPETLYASSVQTIRRVLSLIVSLALICSCITAPQVFAADPDVFNPPDDHEPGQHNILFSDSQIDYFSSLINPTRLSDVTKDPTCKSERDENCLDSNLQFNAIIPACGVKNQTNCLESVGVVTPEGSKVSGKFVGNFPKSAQNQFTGDDSLQLPFGSTSSLVNIDSAPHLGGSQYLVTAFMSGTLDRGNNPARSVLGNFVLRIVPTKLVPTSQTCAPQPDWPDVCVDSGFVNVRGLDGVRRWGAQGPGTDGKQACTIRSPKENLCAETYNFSRELKFFARVRSNLTLSGWLHGRVFQPNISIEKVGTETIFDIEASP